MALGGGTFLIQNKALPGAYINFVSAANASAQLSDRGIATMPLELDWGVEGQVFKVTSGDFQKNSLKIFGYDYTHEKMKGLRDLFRNITTLFAYRLNGGGTKASNAYATAKYAGTRGNDLSIVIKKAIDDESKFVVQTVLGTAVMDEQVVATSAFLVDNDWVDFKTTSSLAFTARTALEGGTNKDVTGTQHSEYLAKVEAFTFNALGVVTTDKTTKALYAAFVKRMRDEVGQKFQVVLYNQDTDYMGVVNLNNKVTDEGANEASLVYWVTGVVAGTAVNKSATNKLYDGEFAVDVNFTQSQLEVALKAGKFTMHQVGYDVRVLEDINSMVTTTDTQGDIFKENQTVRVIDQIANDIAFLFKNKYLGVVPNDVAGRTSLWADIVKHHEQLQDIHAIEDFADEDVVVSQGDTKKVVVVTDAVTVVNAMVKLYMTVTVA